VNYRRDDGAASETVSLIEAAAGERKLTKQALM